MSAQVSAVVDSIIALLVGRGTGIGLIDVVGVALVVSGLVLFKKWTDDKMRYPLAFGVSTLVAGTLLIAADSLYNIVRSTVFGAPQPGKGSSLSAFSPLAPDPAAVTGHINEALGAVGFGKYIPTSSAEGLFMLLLVMGIWAFIRGIWKLKYAGDPNAGPNGQHTVGSALWHIVGGFCLINITTVGNMIAGVVGLA